jgi:murein DD-endopeptidase MepM/ murein hydrolase activator NlpD
MFSSKTDTMTTSSIPHNMNAVNGKLPVPRADIAQTSGIDSDVTGDQALNQPMPSNKVTYDAIDTSTVSESPVRASVTPIQVERTDLKSPTVKINEKVALSQSFSTKKKIVVEGRTASLKADPILTGTTPASLKIAANAPRIVVKSGQTLSGVAAAYHVSKADILLANHMKSGAELKIGQKLVIPVKVAVSVNAKTLPFKQARAETEKKLPLPGSKQESEKVAILPEASSRDKNKNAAASKLADASGKTDTENGDVYVVKSGDSLARIARSHGISVDALKAANGMNTASIRIDQKLKIPTANMAANKADTSLKTASIPHDGKTKIVDSSAPKSYTPPVAEKSVADVQKVADNGEKAPDETGIGKYRWPVRGAVIAAYGQNVDGVRNPGIDISVPEGTPIKAAENGVVIYSGSGLKDLGNTVLIRHEDGTVTVYGNAQSLNVKRGDKVTRGEVIAASGMTGGANRPKLHFEVRQNAAAVNPMTFLQ